MTGKQWKKLCKVEPERCQRRRIWLYFCRAWRGCRGRRRRVWRSRGRWATEWERRGGRWCLSELKNASSWGWGRGWTAPTAPGFGGFQGSWIWRGQGGMRRRRPSAPPGSGFEGWSWWWWLGFAEPGSGRRRRRRRTELLSCTPQWFHELDSPWLFLC